MCVHVCNHAHRQGVAVEGTSGVAGIDAHSFVRLRWFTRKLASIRASCGNQFSVLSREPQIVDVTMMPCNQSVMTRSRWLVCGSQFCHAGAAVLERRQCL